MHENREPTATSSMDIGASLISVVIPTCNRASLLQRAIESVRAQTYQYLEILVVDDASNDETRQVVDGFNDPRMRYVRHATNRGGSAARNTGVCLAQGKYVAFLDDDDTWTPTKLARQLEHMHGLDATSCGALVNGQRVLLAHRTGVLRPCDLRRAYRGAGTSGLLVRTEVIAKTLFDERLRSGQDWDLMIRLVSEYKVGFLNEPLVIYNDGRHERITNRIFREPARDLSANLAILYKHQHYLGRFWFRYHMARMLLYRARERDAFAKHLAYVWSQCGVAAMAAFYLGRAYRRLLGLH